MKILDTRLEQKVTVSYNKIIGALFSVNIKISQPLKMLFT